MRNLLLASLITVVSALGLGGTKASSKTISEVIKGAEPTPFNAMVNTSVSLSATTRRFIFCVSEDSNIHSGIPYLVTKPTTQSDYKDAYKLIHAIKRADYPTWADGYYYVDIPENAVDSTIQMSCLILDPTVGSVSNYFNNFNTRDFSDMASADPLKVTTGVTSSGSTPSYGSHSIAYPTNVTVELAKIVLEGLHSCVNSDINGYGATEAFITNYYEKLSTGDKATFNAATINDIGGATVTCGNKLAMMKTNAGITTGTAVIAKSSIGSNESVVTIIIISTVAIALSAFVIIAMSAKKRRKTK